MSFHQKVFKEASSFFLGFHINSLEEKKNMEKETGLVFPFHLQTHRMDSQISNAYFPIPPEARSHMIKQLVSHNSYTSSDWMWMEKPGVGGLCFLRLFLDTMTLRPMSALCPWTGFSFFIPSHHQLFSVLFIYIPKSISLEALCVNKYMSERMN